MKITLDIDYDDAVKLAEVTATHERFFNDNISALIREQIQNEDERRHERSQELAMESGGADDTQYRDSMKDAGRGHLIR
jgi:hypothetical protein